MAIVFLSILKLDENLIVLLSEWKKKYEELIFRINKFFKSKKTQFKSDLSNLTTVLDEKLFNVKLFN